VAQDGGVFGHVVAKGAGKCALTIGGF
jgi:hypothetical protein